MVPKSRNVVIHPWVFMNDYYFTQWPFILIVGKDYTIHDRESCFIINRMAKYFFFTTNNRKVFFN